ncbi:MAG TPA: hypothetical protein VJM31_05620 [Vicinamibacterales bacterium]|nr:hypothetical protein [Vicinamibacterales bacterium]
MSVLADKVQMLLPEEPLKQKRRGQNELIAAKRRNDETGAAEIRTGHRFSGASADSMSHTIERYGSTQIIEVLGDVDMKDCADWTR